MVDKKMIVEEKKNKKRTRKITKNKRGKEGKGGKKRGNFFETSTKGGQWNEKKKPPFQCLVWFRLNGLDSSQNGQNILIHNWCIGGCWFTQALWGQGPTNLF